MFILAFMLLASGSEKSKDATGFRQVTVSADSRTIPVRTAVNVVTSIRFNRAIDKERLVCGDNQSFIVAAAGDNQLDIKAATTDTRQSTNCNLYTSNGTPVVLDLHVTDKAHADILIEATIVGVDAATLSDADISKRYQRQIDDRVFAAVQECKSKSSQSLAAQAAEAIVSRRLNERAVVGDVILAVHDIVKIGSRGIIRFSVDNQSRDPWAAGTVRLTFVASGPQALAVDVIPVFKNPIADRGEEIFGAITFEMYQLPDTAKFSVQVLERNGSRNPQVNGIRL